MWFYLALSAALASGISTVLSKKALRDVRPALLYWATVVISTPLIAFFAFKDGIPSLGIYFWIGIAGSVILYTVSRILHLRVIRDAQLSHVYPLIALTPIFTLIIASFPPLSERPSSFVILGAIVSLVGCYVLNINSLKEGLLEPFKILFKNKHAFLMLIAVALLGFVTVFDKIAITGTSPQNSIFALFAENIIITVVMAPYLFSGSRKIGIVSEIWNNKTALVVLGLLATISNALGFIAFSGASVGIVSAIFRSQILFALLFGFILFKDKPRPETILGTIIMIAGLVIIKMG